MTDKLKKLFIFFISIIWLVVYFKDIFVFQSRLITNDFPMLYSLSLENKYELIDGEYYLFMKFCQRKIPQDKKVIFVNLREGQEGKFSSLWIQSEYFRQKLPYYLYPRKIYPANAYSLKEPVYKIVYDRTAKGKHFELLFQGIEIQ